MVLKVKFVTVLESQETIYFSGKNFQTQADQLKKIFTTERIFRILKRAQTTIS
jgi:hypothetical protein